MLKSLVGVIVVLTSCCIAPAAEPKRPNILFAIADDASWPHMSAYGCKFVSTPAFDRVAKEAQPRRIDIALSNSFGFGGTNASIIFRGAPLGAPGAPRPDLLRVLALAAA